MTWFLAFMRYYSAVSLPRLTDQGECRPIPGVWILFHRLQLRRAQRTRFVTVARQLFVKFDHQILRGRIWNLPKADDQARGAGVPSAGARRSSA